MRTTTLIFLLILTVSAPIVVYILPWIPSWSIFQGIFIGISFLFALTISFQLLRRLSQHLVNSQASSLYSSFTLVASAIALIGFLAITGLFSGFMAAGGIFPPRLMQTYRFPDAGVNLYYYDHSFLDPGVALYAQRSFWPFMHRVSSGGGHFGESPEAVREGETVTIQPFAYHLDTGECEVVGF